MPHPIVHHYPERYRLYIPSVGDTVVCIEETATEAEMRERLLTYRPWQRASMPVVVHEHPWRFLWFYRVTVVRTITLEEMGLR